MSVDTVTAYRTTDGSLFYNKNDATHHERKIAVYQLLDKTPRKDAERILEHLDTSSVARKALSYLAQQFPYTEAKGE